MRRLVILALLSLSCSYRPTWVDRPAVQPGVGSTRPGIARQMRTGGQGVQLCRVVSRTRCAVETCKASGLDLVTLSCGGEKVTRCEVGKGGC
ncbi:MAG TPA: hypothetical protein VM733_02505 [Thermoanaerobaculia bacterium]|nr:hypothetical protein [Thermoanaerobaculia bacterium]